MLKMLCVFCKAQINVSKKNEKTLTNACRKQVNLFILCYLILIARKRIKIYYFFLKIIVDNKNFLMLIFVTQGTNWNGNKNGQFDWHQRYNFADE